MEDKGYGLALMHMQPTVQSVEKSPSERKSRSEDTAMPAGCVVCGGKDSSKLFDAAGFDDASESFSVVECVTCGLARTDPLMNHKELARYYPSSYYGGERKFVRAIEAWTRFFNHLRAKTIMRLIRASPPRA